MGKIYRCITSCGLVTAMAIDSTDIVYKAEQIHTTSAVITAGLGRLLTAASLMGIALKSTDGSLTLRVKGDGPADALIAVSDAFGNVRGYPLNPVVELPLNSYGKLDVGGAVGRGTLSVSKDVGEKEPYNGTVELVSGEIAEDITAYFAISEQIPTVCALGVLVNPDLTVKAAGGYIIQLLPAAGDDTIELIEDGLKDISSVTEMLSEGLSPLDIVKKVLKNFQVEVLEESNAEYKCNCNKERVENALVSIGKGELTKISHEQGNIEVDCHFCEKLYTFTKDDINQLISKI